MKKNSKKKKLMAAAAALALIAAISGTFAWITSQDQRINKVSSSAVVDNSVTIVEEWEPKPLIGGTEAIKKVAVTNTGTASVYVRVSYEEVLKHLTNKGVISHGADNSATDGTNPKYSYIANDPGLDKHMPVDDVVTGYTEVPAGQVSGLEPDTKLFVKGGRIIAPVLGTISYNDEAKVVHEYDTGKYQTMNATVAFVGAKDDQPGNDASGWNYTVSNSQYGYYDKGYSNKVVNWAKSTLPDANGVAPGTGTPLNEGNALLGTTGDRYGVGYDYTIGTLGLTALPAISVTSNTSQYPIAAEAKAVQSDTSALAKSEIKVNYTAAVVDTAGLAAATNNWIYNSEDGWFYYTQPLANGATTAELLDKLIFGNAMGAEYKNASFDLVVKLEAIQATPEAFTDSTGWGITLDSTTKPITQAIYDKLTN